MIELKSVNNLNLKAKLDEKSEEYHTQLKEFKAKINLAKRQTCN